MATQKGHGKLKFLMANDYPEKLKRILLLRKRKII